MTMLEYGTDDGAFDQSESGTPRSKDGPLEKRSELAKRAIKSAKQKLCRSTRQKNVVVQYGYSDYMAGKRLHAEALC